MKKFFNSLSKAQVRKGAILIAIIGYFLWALVSLHIIISIIISCLLVITVYWGPIVIAGPSEKQRNHKTQI